MRISITNVHLDLGAGRRGTDMGPSAIRVAGLVPKLESMGHEVVGHHSIGQVAMEAQDVGDPNARFLPIIRQCCDELADVVEADLNAGRFPLILGGDHSQAIGSIGGIARQLRTKKKTLGVFCVDAHADMNTPATSPSGNIHGMPLSHVLGFGKKELSELAGFSPMVKPEHVAIFGVRDIDQNERDMIDKAGVRVYSMSEIDERGIRVCIDEAIDIVSKADCIHLSYDLDGSDPSVAPGTGTPVPGGLNFRESHLVCEQLAKSGRLLSMEVVELNPALDIENKTGKFAVWLIQSALGRTIL
ncbi:MAG: arginase [Gammaproteobacteria bacterium]